MEKGQSVFGHGVGIFLSKEEVSPGEQILVYIFAGPNSLLTFVTRTVLNGITKIEVGSPFLDFASKG